MTTLTLSEDLEMLRDAVRRYAEERIAPLDEALDAEGRFPRELWTELGELGLHGMTIPEEAGGTGMGYLAHLVVMEELSRASASIGLSYGAHSNLCLDNLQRNGSPAQRERFVPGLLSGELLGALAMSEPGAGSDVVGSMQCRAVKHGDVWVANGSKMWITNGPGADVVICYMRTAGRDAGSRSITPFLIEKGMPGYSTAQKLDKLGMRGSDTCELVFENCEIPESHVIGEANAGVKVLMSGLNTERLVLSGGPLGIMQAAIDAVLPYVRERRQFDAPIGSFGLMQAKIGDMYTWLQSSRAFAYRVAEDYDAGRRSRIDPASCLLLASQNAVKLTLEAIQALGGNGYINEYPVGRLLRDAKLYDIGAGTNEIRRMLIGRELVEGRS